MEDARSSVFKFLQRTMGTDGRFHPSLVQLWEYSYVHDGVVVLPYEWATAIAESHPDGCHIGVWHLAISYERLMAMALLTNSNVRAPGRGKPKSFSAWPRRHCVPLYRVAFSFRRGLPGDVCETKLA